MGRVQILLLASAVLLGVTLKGKPCAVYIYSISYINFKRFNLMMISFTFQLGM